MKTRLTLQLVLLLAVTFSVACASQKPAVTHGQNEVKQIQKVQITDTLAGSHYKDIYFSQQPEFTDFDELKKQGFAHVISLRTPAEYDQQAEQAKLESLGIAFTNVPFASTDSLTDAHIAKVTQAVMAHRAQGKTLVHCSSGNRVALWVGGHFYKDHHVTPSQAVEAAVIAGMTKAPIEAKLNTYLEGQSDCGCK